MNKQSFSFYNLRTGEKDRDIQLLFPGWREGDERVAIFSPHDDDGILGPGYLVQALPLFGADVHIVIVCNGSGGYSQIEQKHIITSLRVRETARAYQAIGIDEEHIHRLEYDDYSVWPYIGWKLASGGEGTFRKVVPLLRRLKITRVLIPNGHKEHLDHTATFLVGAFDVPQVGDPVMADWGETEPIRSLLQYAVWSDFSPDDALLRGDDPAMRADLAVRAPWEAEENVRRAMEEYRTQAKIVSGLMSQRDERKIGDSALEIYLSYDPRPRCDFKKYVDRVHSIDS